VSLQPPATPRAGPAAIAVHDDRDVLRNLHFSFDYRLPGATPNLPPRRALFAFDVAMSYPERIVALCARCLGVEPDRV
jgi:hypothetical protein